MTDDVDRAKQAVRDRVWSLLDRAGVRTDSGRHAIPGFVGADEAAARLATLAEWRAASVVKANPDPPQLPVRLRALREGRTVYMAVPAMAGPEPFYHLDPGALGADLARSADGRTAGLVAPTVAVSAVRPVDVVVCGSLAVDRDGTRIGKGAGYSDLEIALLCDAGLVTDRTVVVTTVHPLQVLDEPLPRAGHDIGVHFIVTPDEVIRCPAGTVRGGIDWDRLPPERVRAIPALAALRNESSGGGMRRQLYER